MCAEAISKFLSFCDGSIELNETMEGCSRRFEEMMGLTLEYPTKTYLLCPLVFQQANEPYILLSPSFVF